MNVAAYEKPRRFRLGLWLVTGLVAGLLLLLGARYKEAVTERKAFAVASTSLAVNAAKPRNTRVAEVVHGVATHWQPTIAVTGTLAPIRDTNLSFKVTGRLTAVHVRVGDVVKAGQRLAALDPSEAAAQLALANAQVHAAEVQLAIARENERRSQALLAQNAISGAQHLSDQQRAELEQAALEQARAQTKSAAAALQNTQLLAPFGGLVVMAPSAPGAIVTPQAALFRIEDVSSLRLTASISDGDAEIAAVGASAKLAGSGRSGRIFVNLPSVDPQTRRVPIVAVIPNDGPKPLIAGVFVRATITSAAEIEVLKLPASALRPGSQDEVVVVERDKARLVRVSFARAEDGSLLVRSGIEAQDVVLLAPSAEIKDGDTVELARAPVTGH
jgi:RND family efflux transporter MFP subunit